jgi:hypothetical protein
VRSEAARNLTTYSLSDERSSSSGHRRHSPSPSEDDSTSNEEEVPPAKRFGDGDYIDNDEEADAFN